MDDLSSIWDRSSRGIRINFPNRPWFGHCSYREYGTGFDPAVGFNSRNGFRRVDPRVGYGKILEKSNLLRESSWALRYENLWDLDFELLTQNLTLTLVDLRFESGEAINFEMIRNYERLENDFDILRDGSIIIPLDEYRNWFANVELSTASFRKVVGSVEFSTGGFWSGTRTIWELGLILRPIAGINLNFTYSHTDVSMEQGEFQTNLLQFEGGFDLTKDISISSTLQYDDLSKLLGMNHRLRWIVTPGSDVFIVYNQNWLREVGEYRQLDRSSVMKVNYTHRF